MIKVVPTSGGPNWAEIVSAIATVGAAFGVIFAGIQVRDAHRARTAEIVRQLLQEWESPPMQEARMLIGKYSGGGGVTQMITDLQTAKTGPTADYFKFTRHLNFWEQVGLAYGNDRESVKLISYMFGEAVDQAWKTWSTVIPQVWPGDSTVGLAFKRFVERSRKR